MDTEYRHILDRIAEVAGIDPSRLTITPSFLNPEEWHTDRRLMLDGRKVKARWFPIDLASEQAAVTPVTAAEFEDLLVKTLAGQIREILNHQEL